MISTRWRKGYAYPDLDLLALEAELLDQLLRLVGIVGEVAGDTPRYALDRGAEDGGDGIGIARSNDLVNWVKDPNPLFNQEGERWPSVIRNGGTFYMVYTRNYCGTSHIVMRTSSDGQNFCPYQVLVSPQTGYVNQN
jgi:hypothetical protein